MTTATSEATAPTTTPERPTATTDDFINGLADMMAHSARTPILRRPDEYGLAYEDVFFPSQDGVTLEGWFIPADSTGWSSATTRCPATATGIPDTWSRGPTSAGSR